MRNRSSQVGSALPADTGAPCTLGHTVPSQALCENKKPLRAHRLRLCAHRSHRRMALKITISLFAILRLTSRRGSVSHPRDADVDELLQSGERLGDEVVWQPHLHMTARRSAHHAAPVCLFQRRSAYHAALASLVPAAVNILRHGGQPSKAAPSDAKFIE